MVPHTPTNSSPIPLMLAGGQCPGCGRPEPACEYPDAAAVGDLVPSSWYPRVLLTLMAAVLPAKAPVSIRSADGRYLIEVLLCADRSHAVMIRSVSSGQVKGRCLNVVPPASPR
jgi:hypothetical protein